MFVEKLNKEDFLEFLMDEEFVRDEYLRSGCSSDIIRNFMVEANRVVLSIGRVDFEFTDFDSTNNYMFRSYNGAHNKRWLSFMYKKFGDDYKYAFYKHRTQQKRKMLNHMGERFDKDTRAYENLFQVEEEVEV